jgi:hypothetical protein
VNPVFILGKQKIAGNAGIDADKAKSHSIAGICIYRCLRKNVFLIRTTRTCRLFRGESFCTLSPHQNNRDDHGGNHQNCKYSKPGADLPQFDDCSNAGCNRQRGNDTASGYNPEHCLNPHAKQSSENGGVGCARTLQGDVHEYQETQIRQLFNPGFLLANPIRPFCEFADEISDRWNFLQKIDVQCNENGTHHIHQNNTKADDPGRITEGESRWNNGLFPERWDQIDNKDEKQCEIFLTWTAKIGGYKGLWGRGTLIRKSEFIHKIRSNSNLFVKKYLNSILFWVKPKSKIFENRKHIYSKSSCSYGKILIRILEQKSEMYA